MEIVLNGGFQLSGVQGESKLPIYNQEITAFIERFLAEADVAEASKETYRNGLTQFFSWYQSKGLTDITRAVILTYKKEQLERVQATTVGTYLSALRSFFRWLESEKLYPNVAAGVKGVKLSQTHKKDALTPSQVSRVLESLKEKGDCAIAKRNYALFNLMVRTGLRGIEVNRANVGDIRNRGTQTVLYVQGKGQSHKDQFVVLTDAAVRPLYAYLSMRDRRSKDDPLFVSLSTRSYGNRLSLRSLREIMKDAMRGAGYDDDRLTTHSLRHTAVTLALLGGATVQQAQAMARHNSITTTMVYAHNLSRVNDAAEFNIDRMLEI